MSSSNLLKGFGVGANVVQQIATDKALRRKSTGTQAGFSLADGELYQGAVANEDRIPHSLGRKATGCLLLFGSVNQVVVCLEATASDIKVSANVPGTVALWIV